MVDVFSFESPLQIVAARLFVLVLDPASLFQSTFGIAVATLYYENFGFVVNSVLFAPRVHICDVQEHLILDAVPLDETLECLVIVLNFYFFFFLDW